VPDETTKKPSSRPPSSRPPSVAPKLPAIRDYMDTVVPTLDPDMDVHDAVRFLLQKHRTGAPVVDPDGAVIGMLTEYDCLRLLTVGDADHDQASGTVADFMTTEVTTIGPDTDIYYAAGLFLKHNFRRLPVLREGKLIGAITRFDILRAIELNR